MSHSDQPMSSGGLQAKQEDHFITPEKYELPKSASQKLKLTPLDMNMPRLYGARWVLCFPLQPSTNKIQV